MDKDEDTEEIIFKKISYIQHTKNQGNRKIKEKNL